uniref:Sjogren syndrome nuclear autoantigen 1 n=1 Tax=Oryzias melastigma TaxID=30732 RepID=A0A3B3DQG2_ORYME
MNDKPPAKGSQRASSDHSGYGAQHLPAHSVALRSSTKAEDYGPAAALYGIEDLYSKREELNRQIKLEEEEKERLQHDIQILSEKLSKVEKSLAQRLAARATFDRTIGETEAAYTKILESSQSLLSVLKQEAGNLSRATEPRRKDH